MPKDFHIFIGHKDPVLIKEAVEALLPFYTVNAETNGQEIINHVINRQPDLAILDFSIPEIDVLELCEKIDGGYPQVSPVIMVDLNHLEIAKKKWRKRAIDYIVGFNNITEFIEDVNKVVRVVINEREKRVLLRSKIESRFHLNNFFPNIKEILKSARQRSDWDLVEDAQKEIDSIENIIKSIDSESL